MKSKLGVILTIAVVGVIVIGTILLGVIKVDYSPNYNPSYQAITVKHADDKGKTFTANSTSSQENKETFNQFVKVYKNMFKQSVLASVFSGNSGNEVAVEYKAGSFSLSGKAGHEVALNLNKNGEEIATTETANKDKYTIDKVFFVVPNLEGFNAFTIYAQIKADTQGSTTGYIQITTIADTKPLYDFVSDMNF